MAIQLIAREEWSNSPESSAEPLTPPFDRVIITFESRFPKCNNTAECVARIQEIEDHYMKEGMTEGLPYK